MSQPFERVAIVVGHVDTGESDRVVRLITAEDGRLSIFVHRARKSSAVAGLDLAARVRVMLKKGRGDLFTLQSVSLEDGRPHLRRDLTRIAQAAWACELVDTLSRAEHPEPRLFGLLETALTLLDGATGPAAMAFRAGLLAKALTFVGLAPRLTQCAACGLPLEDPAAFAPNAGGALHPACGGGRQVPLALLEALESARRTRLAELLDRELPDGALALLEEHRLWHQGRPLRSAAVLDSLS